jgi:hypothetical protein
MISKLRARWYLAVGAALLAAAVAVPVVVLSAGGSDSSSISLDGIDINTLAAQGIFVTLPPQGYAPAVDSNAAEKAGSEFYPSVAARQVILAHVKTAAFGGLDTNAWIVNLNPHDSNITPVGAGGTTQLAFLVVDANDGHVLFYGSATAPPPGGWGPDMGPGLSTPRQGEEATPPQSATPAAAQ